MTEISYDMDADGREYEVASDAPIIAGRERRRKQVVTKRKERQMRIGVLAPKDWFFDSFILCRFRN